MALENSVSQQMQVESSPEPELSRSGSSRGLNAKAPKFVPRVTERVVVVPIHHLPLPHAVPIHVYHPVPPAGTFFAAAPPPPQFDYYAGYVDHEALSVVVDPDPALSLLASGKEGKDLVADDVVHKITKQVEYYFSDINLATTEHLIRFITKDPEGFVPINVIASFKKIKALVTTYTQLANALRSSNKLIVSDDSKRVKRAVPFTQSDLEALQSRIVVAENLPEDHCYQNLMKVFSAVGSVKTIRTCYPQTPTGTGPVTNRSAKLDMLFPNKLHAFVEYASVEDAQRAIAELNNENWRNGLRVRLLHVCVKSGTGMAKGKKDANGEVEDAPESSSPPSNEKVPHQQFLNDCSPRAPESSHLDNLADENSNGGKRGGKVNRGRGNNNNYNNKGRGRGGAQNHNHQNTNNNHNHRSSPNANTQPSNSPTHNAENPLGAPKLPPGPRMPDGTRGFSMGRGKPLSDPAPAAA